MPSGNCYYLPLTLSTDRLGLECGSGQKGLQPVKGQESFPGGSDPLIGVRRTRGEDVSRNLCKGNVGGG